MNAIDKLVTWMARARKLGSFHVSQELPGWVRAFSTYDVASGVQVDEQTALEYSAVWSCIRVLSETVASLPLHLYRRRPDGGKERSTDHPLYNILHDAPNPETTSFYLRETLMGHLCGWGNAYAELELNRRGEVTGIWPLRPDRMKVSRQNGQLSYTYRLPKPDDQGNLEAILPTERVLHIPGLGYDGVVGYSPVQMARSAIGLGIAAGEFGSRFFGNDARPGVVLEHPGEIGDEAHKRLRESWETRHQGLEASHRVAVLEEGMTLKEIGIPPEEAQFLETRKFQRSEIASIYRVPPHMIGDLERATFSNIEHQSIEFVVYSIRPWLVRWEQAMNQVLLTAAERREYFIEHLVDGLLRGDIGSRYAAYATGRQNGWLSANDVRQMENMNPIDDGDVYMVPLNMIPASQVSGFGPTPGMENNATRADVSIVPGPEKRGIRSAQERHRLQQAYHRVYRDVAARVLRRERNDVSAAAKKQLGSRGLPEFQIWLEEFYAEHGRFVFSSFEPVARAYAELVAGAAHDEVGELPELTETDEAFVRDYLVSFAARHCNVSRARLSHLLLEAVDPLEAIEAELAGWPEKRAEETARWEAVRFGNALAKAIYISAGIIRLRWRAFDESCPYCTALDGQVVGVQEFFLQAGSAFQPEGASHPLTPQHNVGYAPAHDGCDCMVVAG